MTTSTNSARPSEGFTSESDAFFEVLGSTSPGALSACAGWTAHEITAHLAAAAVEVALNLEAYGEGRPVPPTRGMEEREGPYRAMEDDALRAQLPRSLDRMAAILDAVLAAEPGAVVPWTGRQMVVAAFVAHLRSEFAIHRWDLAGDDDTSMRLLAQPELTDHAVTVLGRALPARGAASAPTGFSAVLAAPGTPDVIAVTGADGPRLIQRPEGSSPAVTGDPAARLLFLWGRRPADPRRLTAPRGAAVMRRLQLLLAGY